MSQLTQIWIKRAKGGPMDASDRARLVAGKGIVGNANQRGKRQVTILSDLHWKSVTAPLGQTPGASIRRCNLLVSDINFENSRGKILKIGDVRIRIFGETRPCEQMEEAVPGLRAAMSVPWGGGAFGEVLDDGEIAIGDSVELLEPQQNYAIGTPGTRGTTGTLF